jgi:hypothetical protein
MSGGQKLGMFGLGAADALVNAYGGRSNAAGAFVDQKNQERADAIKNYLTKRQIGKEDAGAADEAKKLAEEAELNKPGGRMSAILESSAKRLDPRGDYSGLSAPQLGTVIPLLREGRKLEAQEKANQLREQLLMSTLGMKKEVADQKRTEKDEAKKQNLTNTLYRRTQSGPLGEMNKLRQIANVAKRNIESFSQNPSGYSDYGTLMSSLKSLQGDTSVVREAELKLGKNATSLMNKASNALEQAVSGKSLQPEQRQQIVQVMGALSQGYDEAYRKAAAPTVETARKHGIPLSEVFDDPGSFEPKSQITEEDIDNMDEDELREFLAR